jgi:hypothetical protein
VFATQARDLANLMAQHAEAAFAFASATMGSAPNEAFHVLFVSVLHRRAEAKLAATHADAAFKLASDAWHAHNERFGLRTGRAARSAPTTPSTPTAATPRSPEVATPSAATARSPEVACAAGADAKRPSGGQLLGCAASVDACTRLPMEGCRPARIPRAIRRRWQRGGRR